MFESGQFAVFIPELKPYFGRSIYKKIEVLSEMPRMSLSDRSWVLNAQGRAHNSMDAYDWQLKAMLERGFQSLIAQCKPWNFSDSTLEALDV